MEYRVLLVSPPMLTPAPGRRRRVRPTFNVVISNVPGPEQPLYFRGAGSRRTYPMSIPVHGQALNITCNSYAGRCASGSPAVATRYRTCSVSPCTRAMRLMSSNGFSGAATRRWGRPGRPGRRGRSGRRGRCVTAESDFHYQRSDQGRRSSSNVQASRGCWCRNQYASAMCSGARIPSSVLSA